MSGNQESNNPILRPSIIQFLHTVNYQTLDCGKAREARVDKINDIFLSVLL